MSSTEGFEELIRLAQDGDRAAMDRVIELLRPSLEPLARSFADPAAPSQSASDLLQECCLRAWRKLEGFEGGKNDEETFKMFRAWMSQILRRVGLNAQRNGKAKSRIPRDKLDRLRPGRGDTTNPAPPVEIPAISRTASEGARMAEETELILEALRELPDKSASAIVRYRFFEGLTIPQIAERLELSRHQVRERYRSAMRRLRDRLGRILDV